MSFACDMGRKPNRGVRLRSRSTKRIRLLGHFADYPHQLVMVETIRRESHEWQSRFSYRVRNGQIQKTNRRQSAWQIPLSRDLKQLDCLRFDEFNLGRC